jgi:molybdopterin synthase sulfur carrier subunit
MIDVLFFAHLKETLDCERLQLEADDATTVAMLRDQLCAKGQVWQKNLSCGSTLVAVNQAMANEQTPINEGDEVAFFPPVTGG